MHIPVLYHEIIDALQPHTRGLYVDGTLGAGGHAWGILEASNPDGKLLGLDLDPQALSLAQTKLAPFGPRAILQQASYTTLRQQLVSLDWTAVNGILLDLGVSSMQLDTAERGFSFRNDAPLDMRFSPEATTTAEDLVNHLSETDLANLIFRYGEEKQSRKIARAIIAARPISTTMQLAEVIAKAGIRQKPGIHPATQTFQALRIAVNDELEGIKQVLPQAVAALASGGRLAIISFHSLEDRIVKQFFRQESRDCLCPPKQPICTCGHKASITEITRKPLQPTEAETRQNPRARSSRLRVAEKL